jgi:putative peptidoglycan lipid II flippase
MQFKPISLLKSSAIVSGLTMLSRVFGMVREIMIAYFFGASVGTDAFFVANRIPNLLRRIFAEGAFNQAFIPLLGEYRHSQSHEEVLKFISHTGGLLLGALLILLAIVELVPSGVIMLFAPGFSSESEKFAIAADMLRITFPYIVFIALVNLTAGILNSYGRFVIPALTHSLFNLSFIAAIALLSPNLAAPYMALAWAVLLAGILQLSFGLPALIKLNLFSWPRINWQDKRIKRLVTLMLPAAFGASIVQINLMIDNILASFLPTGSISWLSYSIHLMELPVALFGIAIATTLLPYLSDKHAQGAQDQGRAAIDWGLKMVLMLGIPSAIALVVLSDAIVTSLFNYGSLTAADVAMSAASLRAYSLGLLFIMLIRVIVPVFFAHQDTKTPVKIALVAMVVNIVGNLALIYWLAHVGLALATSLAACIHAILLLVYLHKRNWYSLDRQWFIFTAKLILANCILVAMLLVVNPSANWWLISSMWLRVGSLAAICAGGLVMYLLLLRLVGIKLHKFKL